MTHDVTPTDPEQALRTNRILWLALLFSQLIYVVILLLVAQPLCDPSSLAVLPLAFGAAAAGSAVAAHLFWRRATGAGRALHDEPVTPAAAFQGYVLAWVLDESIAIYGMVLGFLGFPLASWAPFSAAAFALMLAHRPRAH